MIPVGSGKNLLVGSGHTGAYDGRVTRWCPRGSGSYRPTGRGRGFISSITKKKDTSRHADQEPSGEGGAVLKRGFEALDTYKSLVEKGVQEQVKTKGAKREQ